MAELGIEVETLGQGPRREALSRAGAAQGHLLRPRDLRRRPAAWPATSPGTTPSAPLTAAARRDLQRLHTERKDPYPGLTSAQKKARLARISYADYLTDVLGLDPGVLPVLQTRPHSLYGVGIDAVPAQDAWGLGLPGFDGLALEPGARPGHELRRDPERRGRALLLPFPGRQRVHRAPARARAWCRPRSRATTADDLVTARADYAPARRGVVAGAHPPQQHRRARAALRRRRRGARGRRVPAGRARPRRPRQPLRARLLEHGHPAPRAGAAGAAEGRARLRGEGADRVHERAAARLEGVPEARRARRPRAGRVPHRVQPGPAGQRRAPTGRRRVPDEPVRRAHGAHAVPAGPARPRAAPRRPAGPARDARSTRSSARSASQLSRALRDGRVRRRRATSRAITVNRWPHGYAYQYNSLWDPFWLDGGEPPCRWPRRPFGRIAIANADAAAYSYTDAAIDQAYRAVREVLA